MQGDGQTVEATVEANCMGAGRYVQNSRGATRYRQGMKETERNPTVFGDNSISSEKVEVQSSPDLRARTHIVCIVFSQVALYTEKVCVVSLRLLFICHLGRFERGLTASKSFLSSLTDRLPMWTIVQTPEPSSRPCEKSQA